MSAESIAKGLTEAQRQELRALSDKGANDRSLQWCVQYGYQLERLGLSTRGFFTDRSYLTPLGAEVRRILTTEGGGNGN